MGGVRPRPGRGGYRGRPIGFRGGPNGIVGGGVVGGKASESQFELDQSGTRLRDHDLEESGKFGTLAAGKKFDAGNFSNLKNNKGAIHKHQVFDNGKTIISSHDKGVNDLDVVGSSNEFNTGSQVSKSGGFLASGGSQQKREKDSDIENDKLLLGSSNSEVAAGGAAAGAIV